MPVYDTMVRKEIVGLVDATIAKAKAPERLRGVHDVFQRELFDLHHGSRVEFPSKLSDYLETNYPEDDREMIYQELVRHAIVYARRT